jgi:two-component system OmpR family response regulator
MVKRTIAKTILVIEDDPSLQNFLCRVLDLEGYHVFNAGDGLTGITLLKNNPVDLVLLDMRLPGPDGWSILREIKGKKEFSQIPIIVITAVADSVQRRRTIRMGAAQYLIKPLSAHKLSKSVADILKQTENTHHTARERALCLK